MSAPAMCKSENFDRNHLSVASDNSSRLSSPVPDFPPPVRYVPDWRGVKIPVRSSTIYTWVRLSESQSGPDWSSPVRYRLGSDPDSVCVNYCVCLLLQYLLQSCSRRGGGGMEDMCYERLRAKAGVN